MKRSELEKYLGKKVRIKIFDGDIMTGKLHKTGEEDLYEEPNLYIPKNFYFLTDTPKCIFRSSHVVELKLLRQNKYD